jgi:hypothetical protein
MLELYLVLSGNIAGEWSGVSAGMESSEAGTAAQQLALNTLPAIH